MIVTAYSDIGSVVEAINGGEVSRYFIKPWREEELADAIRAGIDAFQLVAVTRDLQVRLLQQEQQSTTTYLLGRMLHEVVSPAVGIRDNLGFVVDGVSQLSQMAVKGDPDVPRVANDLLPALTDAHDSAIDLVGRIERFRQGDATVAAPGAGTGLDRAIQTAAGIVRARLQDRARLIVDTNHKAMVKAEPTQLTQIIVNLLLNAYEAIEPGHRTRTRSPSPPSARVIAAASSWRTPGPAFRRRSWAGSSSRSSRPRRRARIRTRARPPDRPRNRHQPRWNDRSRSRQPGHPLLRRAAPRRVSAAQR